MTPPGPGQAPPLFHTRPDPACRSLAAGAFRTADALGIRLMPWQRRALRLALTVDQSGTGWRYATVVVTTPRRAGKTTTTWVANVHRGLAFPGARCFYTAQTGQDARDFYREALETLMPSPLAAAIRGRPRMAAGSEAITWRNGSIFRPFSPQPDALHGKATDLVTVDESWSYTLERAEALTQAISPTQLTRPWRQLWYPSTAGDRASDWFRALVERGRASVTDPESRTAFIEYGTPEHMDPTDPDAWPYSHPAYGITVTREALTSELERMGAEAFARAYGNRWPAIESAGGWPDGAWPACADPDAQPSGALVFGADISIDRSRASIAVASDGPTVEMIEASRPGTDWVAPRLAQLARDHGGRILVNPAGPAATIPPALAALGATCETLDGPAYAAACAALFDSVAQRRARIRPNPLLDAAQAAAGRRPMGDRWAWQRRGAVDVSPLTAATVAVAGVEAIAPAEPVAPAPAWYVP